VNPKITTPTLRTKLVGSISVDFGFILPVVRMAIRIKIYALDHEDAEPRWIGPVGANDGASYSSLREMLESVGILPWKFQFWDIEDSCRMNVKLESLNSILPVVHVIPAEGEGGAGFKRQRIERDDIESVGGLPSNSAELEGTTDPVEGSATVIPASTSRVTGSSRVEAPLVVPEIWLQSTLISAEVMDKYILEEENLRRKLKGISLEDHDWKLKSFDHNGVGVVKIYCLDCNKHHGGISGDHTSHAIQNLFNNFKGSHLGSTAHDRNWCKRHNVPFEHHPRSEAGRLGKGVIMTPEDHAKLIADGIDIVKKVNADKGMEQPCFEVVGNPLATQVKCFWTKVKCVTCNQFLQLCPPKRNLEHILTAHAAGSKHKELLDKAQKQTAGVPLSTGKRGRPSRTAGFSGSRSQTSLHSWFPHSGEGSQACDFTSWDRGHGLSYICWGFRGPSCSYGGKPYNIRALVNDAHPGKNWFAEPCLRGEVMLEGGLLTVEGAFRHRNCLRISASDDGFENLTCTKCASIPSEDDFRMRVLREDRAIEKRGTRSTGSGRRVGYLHMLEVNSHSRQLSQKFRRERSLHWAAKARIVQLKVKRPTLKESAKLASDEHDLMKFCNNILAAHRSGVFGGKPALWDFMKDSAANLNRKDPAHRFSDNSKAFAQAMKMYGGKRMCDLFALNYAGPGYSTVKRDCRKGVQFVPGEHSQIFKAVAQIYADAKKVHGITGPVPVILAEDETKVKSRVAYEQKWDSLAGFCGVKDNHVCISDYKLLVGSGDEGYSRVVEGFRTNKVGGFARVVVVNPLHDKLPRLVLVVSYTCNCFNAAWVRDQWKTIERLWEKECKGEVGPIVGHASDGDSRRRQLMLSDYKETGGTRLKLDWEGWLFSAGVDNNGDAFGLHDQDYIHNGKKLINPIDQGGRTLMLGGDVCMLEHVGAIYNKFTQDEHGLRQGDIDRTDRQNWASAQRLCQKKVTDCLAKVRLACDVQRERTIGTEYYLSVVGDYIDIFASPSLDLRSRLVLASKVSFFFRLWKLWFKYGDHSVLGNTASFSVKENFISQQSFIDVQLSCHFAVLLICHFRDKYSHLPVPLHLTGSDSCEIFFSKIGGMVGLERAYDFHELVNTANTVNRLAAVEYGANGLKFNRVHNKMTNVWADLHPLAPEELPCDLGNYSLITTNDDVIAALKEGLKEAQRLLRALNMGPRPGANAQSSRWFISPWTCELANPRHFAFVPNKKPVEGEDGDSEVMREITALPDRGELESDEEGDDGMVPDNEQDGEQDGLPCTVEQETRDVITELLNESEEHVRPPAVSVKILPYVMYGGKTIYKSTLVSQLNANPFLSKDRLTRVKNSIFFNNADDYLSAASSNSKMLIGCGSDCGIYFLGRGLPLQSSAVTTAQKRTRGKQGRGVAAVRVSQAVEEGSWWIGRVQRIRRRKGRGFGILKHPIDLMNLPSSTGKKGASESGIQIYLNYYSRGPGRLKFRYDLSDSNWVDVESIISSVALTYNSATKMYSLDSEDASSFDTFVSNKN
jgi:hypothetical protein